MTSLEIESFDTKLAQRIQALSSQIEDQTLHLAELRRTAPLETSQRFQDSFTHDAAAYDARLEHDETARLDEAKSVEIKMDDMQRLDEVQSSWQTGSESLNALKLGLGGTVAKMERAQQAADVLQEH